MSNSRYFRGNRQSGQEVVLSFEYFQNQQQTQTQTQPPPPPPQQWRREYTPYKQQQPPPPPAKKPKTNLYDLLRPSTIKKAAAATTPEKVKTDEEQITFNRNEANKRKAKLKREKEREEKTEAKLRDFARLDAFVVKKEKRTDDAQDLPVPPVLDLSEMHEDGGGGGSGGVVTIDDIEDFSEEKIVVSTPSQNRREAIIGPRTIPAASKSDQRPRLNVVDASTGVQPVGIDWPEDRLMKRFLQPFNLSCCNQQQCTRPDHHHNEDASVLGVQRRRSQEASTEHAAAANAAGDNEQCLMPQNPFNADEFELFRFLQPEAFVLPTGADNQPLEMTRFNNGATAAELDDMVQDAGTGTGTGGEDVTQFASLMMRLRKQYFIELANIRATYERSRAEVDARHEADLIYARKCEDDDYAAETKRARERERELVRNIVVSSNETLDGYFHNLTVRTLVQCTSHTSFALPMPMIIKLCTDVIRLDGGAQRDEGFYFQLFVNIANGTLDPIEREKRRVAHSNALARDVYHSEAQEKPFPTPPEKPYVPPSSSSNNNSTTTAAADLAASKKRKNPNDDDDDDDIDTVANGGVGYGDYDDDDDNDYDDKPPPPPPPAKPAKPRVVRYAFPCASQQHFENGYHACTAIAFHAALRLITARFLPVVETLGLQETIFTQLDWKQILQTGAEIWRVWWNERQEKLVAELERRALLSGSAAAGEKLTPLNGSDFMLASEVVESSKAVRDSMARFNLVSYEAFGYWASDITARAAVEDSPSLEKALVEAEKHDVFAAVLTVRGQSLCVARHHEGWFFFDSHARDKDDHSSLFQFNNRHDIVNLVHNSFNKIEMDAAGHNEYVAMQANTYSLFVLHYK